jgi:hypothetical protein
VRGPRAAPRPRRILRIRHSQPRTSLRRIAALLEPRVATLRSGERSPDLPRLLVIAGLGDALRAIGRLPGLGCIHAVRTLSGLCRVGALLGRPTLRSGRVRHLRGMRRNGALRWLRIPGALWSVRRLARLIRIPALRSRSALRAMRTRPSRRRISTCRGLFALLALRTMRNVPGLGGVTALRCVRGLRALRWVGHLPGLRRVWVVVSVPTVRSLRCGRDLPGLSRVSALCSLLA